MASLTLAIGPLTATANADNAKAQEILTLYGVARDMPNELTAQQQLNWIVSDLRRHIVEVARGAHIRSVLDTAEESARTEALVKDW